MPAWVDAAGFEVVDRSAKLDPPSIYIGVRKADSSFHGYIGVERGCLLSGASVAIGAFSAPVPMHSQWATIVLQMAVAEPVCAGFLEPVINFIPLESSCCLILPW